MSKESEFKAICESCDEEYTIVTEHKGIVPDFCPFCGEGEINVERQSSTTIIVDDVEDDYEVVEEDD